MRKFISMFVAALVLCSVLAVSALSAVTVMSNGTNLGAVERVDVSTGLAVTKDSGKATIVASGTQAITGGTINGAVIGGVTPAAATVTSLTVDGTIYTAKVMADGAIYGGRATTDPCGTLGAGYIFFNHSTGVPCYCSNTGVDLAIYSATASCF